jgi:hypothetical protein
MNFLRLLHEGQSDSTIEGNVCCLFWVVRKSQTLFVDRTQGVLELTGDTQSRLLIAL